MTHFTSMIMRIVWIEINASWAWWWDISQPWRFSSKRTDEESHLIYFGRRYYDPSLGRWLTQDPLGYADGPNLYAYVSNNPLTHQDLYGLAVAGSHSNDRDSPRKGRLSEPTQERSRESSGSTWSQVSEFAGGLVGSVWDPIEAGLEIYDNKPQSTARKIGQATGLILSVVPVVRIGSFALRALNYSVKGIQLCKNIRMLNNAKSAVNATRTAEKIGGTVRTAGLLPKTVKDALTQSFKKSTRNRFFPDARATGTHTVFRRDPLTNRVTHYETYRFQTNRLDPKPWESVKRFDGTGKGHTNKILREKIETPHMHDTTSPGGIRHAYDWEIPNW